MVKQNNPTTTISPFVLVMIFFSILALSFGNSGETTSQDTDEIINDSTMFISYDFSKPTFEMRGEYDYPVMAGLRNEENPGSPVVPVKYTQILLPKGEYLVSIEVIAKNEVTIDGEYFIKPGGTPISFSSINGPPPQLKPNPAIYYSEDRYPSEIYSDISIQWCRGYQILIIGLYPLQYIPPQEKVLYYETFEVAVTTKFSGEESPLYRGLQEDRNLVERLVDNPSVLSTYDLDTTENPNGGIVPLSITNSSDSYDYVIITNDNLAASFQSFADYKNSTGMETVVVKIEDILADPDYDGVDDQERIRNFINDSYINWSVKYVLLGGDDEIIPHRGCYGFVNGITPSEDNDIPTDLYYGGLDGTWNEGANTSRWGEVDDNPDLYAEVYVGRAPVNTISEVQTFHNKVLDFESNPRPKHVTLHGETDSSGPYYLDYIKNGEGGVFAPGVESFIPSNYNITKLYERNGVTIDVATWESEIANNTLFVNHGGHGNVQSYEIQEGTFYNDGDAYDIVNSYYPIHLSIACYSGSFDGRKDDMSYVADKDSMAEEYIINPNGGMVACILNSRYGWFLTGDVTAYSGELDNKFYDHLFNNNTIKIGKTLQRTKEDFAPWALLDGTYRWVVYEWNLLGDPTMDIFGKDNETPIANAGPDKFTDEDISILFDASSSSDNSGKIEWYNWSFGDGNKNSSNDPLKFHTYTDPGYYTAVLNVSDPSGNWDTDIVNITVYDATPPNTTLTIGEPKYRENQNDGWNVTSFTSFSLPAQDEGVNCSGWNFTWYMIDSDYYVYTIPFDFSSYGEGTYTLAYGSVDLVGNNETGTSAIISVDDSEPTSFLNISHPKFGAGVNEINVTSATQFTNDAVDNLVGINITWWYVNDIGNYSITASFDFTGFAEGTYILYYGAQDFLGNNETSLSSITVIIDDTEPVTGLTIGTPKYGDEIIEINVTSVTSFTLFPSDNMVGVNFTWYKIDGVYHLYSGPFDFILLGEGVYTLIYGSEDLVENNETGTTIIVKVDDSEPDSSLIIGDPKYGDEILKINVTSNTHFTINANDDLVGMDKIWWYINDMGNYFETVTFDFNSYGEGTHTLFYGASDLLGNNDTTPASITVSVDNSKPITTLIIGQPKYGNGVTDINVTQGTSFVLNGFDFTVGVDTGWRYINDILNYTEGNSFDFLGFAEGIYTLYYGSRDLLGHNETVQVITVYVDRQHPISKPLEADSPSHRKYDVDGWNVTNTTIIFINSSDDYSGVAFSWYIIDGKYFEGNSFNLTGYDEGKHTIVFGSQDNLGRNETGHSELLYLDNTPPNSTLKIGEPKYRGSDIDDWNVTGSTTFIFSSNDTYSGVEVIWFTLDGKYLEESFLTLEDEEDGKHVITWGARDRLGNNETGIITIVYTDTQAPKTIREISGPKYRLNDTDDWNITWETTFNLISNDEYSGINFTWYIIDGIYFQGTIFDLDGKLDGKHIIKWGAMDFSGNNETDNILIVYIDRTPPNTYHFIGLPSYHEFDDDDLNVTSNTPIDLTYFDRHSGVNVTWYTIDDDYFEGLNFNLSGYDDGRHVITWGSRDNLNHNETANTTFLYLDDTPPITELTIGNPKYREGMNDSWNVTRSTYFSLSSEDDLSGLDFIWYTIDGVYYEKTDFFLTASFDGLHNITFGAQDRLGNREIINNITIYLDTTPPSVVIYIGGNPVNQTPYRLNSSTPITLMADDAGSGIVLLWFGIDDISNYAVYHTAFTVPVNTTKIFYGAIDNLGNNASGISIRIIVKDEQKEVIVEDEDEEPEEASFGEKIGQFFTDYLFLFIIIIIVCVLIMVLLARKKKGKEEDITFQAEKEVPPPPLPPPPPPIENEEVRQDDNIGEIQADELGKNNNEVDWEG